MRSSQNNYAFTDGQNLYLSISSLGWKLDSKRFRTYLVSVEKVSLFPERSVAKSKGFREPKPKGYPSTSSGNNLLALFRQKLYNSMRKSPKEYSKMYHEELYRNARLFQSGSWLEKPDEGLLVLVKHHFDKRNNIVVLDLGCGVGRNAIPIAKVVGQMGGRVVCVDFVKGAIEKLGMNAKTHNVEHYIEGQVSDIEVFEVKKETYDLIIAISVLEFGSIHEKAFDESLEKVMNGTKKGGINYLGIATNLTERDERSDEVFPSDIVVSLSFQDAERLLKDRYHGWNILALRKEPYEERYYKDGRNIVWRTDYLYFAAQKTL